MTPANVHATAIVLGTTGLLFVGPSGSGKSTLALDCLLAAGRANGFAALVSDDQVLLSRADGYVIGRPPVSIKGLIEVRGSGIAHVKTIDAAILHFAISLVRAPFNERMPAENEVWKGAKGIHLPLIRLPVAETSSNFERLQMILPAISIH